MKAVTVISGGPGGPNWFVVDCDLAAAEAHLGYAHPMKIKSVAELAVWVTTLGFMLLELVELAGLHVLKPYSHAESHRPVETAKFQFVVQTSAEAFRSDQPFYRVVDLRPPSD